MLSTVAPYTALRPDVYRALIQALDVELRLIPRMPSSWPFERGFDASRRRWGGRAWGLRCRTST
uniref:Xylanase inhibitor C-terminal domain-containing protein n=1 Tax=Oryza brachyantha TaxID=4533 RepID=J3L7M7_ORYBR